jgi:hypothetical protein
MMVEYQRIHPETVAERSTQSVYIDITTNHLESQSVPILNIYTPDCERRNTPFTLFVVVIVTVVCLAGHHRN